MENTAREMKLLFQGKKCSVLSLVPSGREKKIKIVTIPEFRLRDGSLLPQLDTTAEWRYLGVDFRPAGSRKVGSDISIYLSRLSRAPLKSQQRLKIVRCFLLPRLYHSLVLGKATLGKLRALDVTTRAAVRRWLRLPGDTPTAFFHSSVSSGGLGIPALATKVLGLLLQRLCSLETSTAPQVQAVAHYIWAERRREWARRGLIRDGFVWLLSTCSVRGGPVDCTIRSTDLSCGNVRVLIYPRGGWITGAMPFPVVITSSTYMSLPMPSQRVFVRLGGCGVSNTSPGVVPVFNRDSRARHPRVLSYPWWPRPQAQRRVQGPCVGTEERGLDRARRTVVCYDRRQTQA